MLLKRLFEALRDLRRPIGEDDAFVDEILKTYLIDREEAGDH